MYVFTFIHMYVLLFGVNQQPQTLRRIIFIIRQNFSKMVKTSYLLVLTTPISMNKYTFTYY